MTPIFRKRSVIVYPRSRDIKQRRTRASLGGKEHAELKASANFRSAQTVIYGELLSDYQPRMV